MPGRWLAMGLAVLATVLSGCAVTEYERLYGAWSDGRVTVTFQRSGDFTIDGAEQLFDAPFVGDTAYVAGRYTVQTETDLSTGDGLDTVVELRFNVLDIGSYSVQRMFRERGQIVSVDQVDADRLASWYEAFDALENEDYAGQERLLRELEAASSTPINLGVDEFLAYGGQVNAIEELVVPDVEAVAGDADPNAADVAATRVLVAVEVRHSTVFPVDLQALTADQVTLDSALLFGGTVTLDTTFQIDGILGTSIPVFIGLTIVLFGGAAFMSGQALANGWKAPMTGVFYASLLAFSDMFLVYGLFDGDGTLIVGYLLRFAVLTGIFYLGYRVTQARKMVTQYPWIYERDGVFGWKARPGALVE